jgi:hypothetical protein
MQDRAESVGRTQEAVDAFAHPKISVGAELSVVAGPMDSGRALAMDGSPTLALH